MDCYDINLKHLAYFSKVARLGSINKAAQLLYISQSHLGKIIHDLEKTVGAPLSVSYTHLTLPTNREAPRF